jgi:hypothetical protein
MKHEKIILIVVFVAVVIATVYFFKNKTTALPPLTTSNEPLAPVATHNYNNLTGDPNMVYLWNTFNIAPGTVTLAKLIEWLNANHFPLKIPGGYSSMQLSNVIKQALEKNSAVRGWMQVYINI